MEQRPLVLALQCLFVAISHQSLHQKRKCIFQIDLTKNHKYFLAGKVNGSVQHCEETHCCLAIYMIVNGESKVDSLACDLNETYCPEPTCIPQPRFKNRFLMCQCSTDLCNDNVTWSSEPEQPPLTPSYSAAEILTSAVVVAALFFAGFIVITIKWKRQCKEKTKMENQDEEENLPLSRNDYSIQGSCSCQTTASGNDITDIELQEVVGRGHFAKVFQGRYNKCVVAVKVYPAGWKSKFITEKEIYELPLKHSGIVEFLGTGRKPDDGSWFIVLQHAEYGSLHSYLSKNTSSWMLSMKLCQSLSQGLSYLHSDLLSHAAHKPPVAHRDLSTFNVLVKADGSCALCDFGCSTILRSCSGQHNMTNMKDHTQFGTLHYMSPEILEGLVNLNSSSFPMQGDIYALSLILWEIWTRCSDLFEGVKPNETSDLLNDDGSISMDVWDPTAKRCGIAPQHHLPYEQELEANVTQERLILYVSDMDMRPSIPEHWDTLPQGSELKELLMDCWDRDAEARLTAPCVENRLVSLQASCSQ